jgi:serine/threonine protein kinase
MPGPPPPSTLADFSFEGRLGKGSFGEVHKVTRRVDGRTYVMKQIEIGGLSAREQRDAINEVHVMASLSHPFVVRYFDSFLDAETGTLCIVMEACEGDLQKYLKQCAAAPSPRHPAFPLPEALVWAIFVQTLLGLAYLHSRRTLHRDLKSANIFLTGLAGGGGGVGGSGGGVGSGPGWFPGLKIGDLGVARVLGTDSNFAKTVVGTPYYLSPELCEDKPYNEKSDIWALGCVLYELCTGRHPFDARNQGALILKIIQGNYPPVPDTYSAHLRGLVGRLLTRDTRRRPTALEVLADPIVAKHARSRGFPLPPAEAVNPVSVEGEDGEAAAGSPAPGASATALPNPPGEEPELASSRSFVAVEADGGDGEFACEKEEEEEVEDDGRHADSLRSVSPLEAEADALALELSNRRTGRAGVDDGWSTRTAGEDTSARPPRGAPQMAPQQKPQPQRVNRWMAAVPPAVDQGARIAGGARGASRGSSAEGAANRMLSPPPAAALAPAAAAASSSSPRPPPPSAADGGAGSGVGGQLRARRVRVRRGDPTGGARPPRKALLLSEEARKAAAEAEDRAARAPRAVYGAAARPATVASSGGGLRSPAAAAVEAAGAAAAAPVHANLAAAAEARRQAAEVAALPDVPSAGPPGVVDGRPSSIARHLTASASASARVGSASRRTDGGGGAPSSRPTLEMLLAATTAVLAKEPVAGSPSDDALVPGDATSWGRDGGSFDATRLGASADVRWTVAAEAEDDAQGYTADFHVDDGERAMGAGWAGEDDDDGGYDDEGGEGEWEGGEDEEALADLLAERQVLLTQAAALEEACAQAVPPEAADRLLGPLLRGPADGPRRPGTAWAGAGRDDGDDADGGTPASPQLSPEAYLLLYRLEYCVGRLAEVDAELAAAGFA